MKPITILLSAAGSPTMPGLLKCFRNNGERDIRIVGVDMLNDPTINFMVDVYYQVPSATSPNCMDKMLQICEKEQVNIYFPNISAEVTAVAERLNEFEQLGTKVSISNPQFIPTLNNKLRAYETLKLSNIPVPAYYPVYSVEDFINGCTVLGYPDKAVCLKLTSNSGSRGVRIIDSSKNRYQIFANEKPNSFFTAYEDMIAVLQSAARLDEMMLVEYMPGNEYTVDLLAEEGTTLYIAGRENVVSLMSIAQKSIVAKNEHAFDVCRKIVELFHLSGNVGFDFMKGADGTPVLMDINPRITATVSLFAAAGLNLPYLRLKQLLGEKLPPCSLNEGTTLIRRYGEYFIDSSGRFIDAY